MLIDFLQAMGNLALVLFVIRFIQTRLDPSSDFGKALAYIFH